MRFANPSYLLLYVSLEPRHSCLINLAVSLRSSSSHDLPAALFNDMNMPKESILVGGLYTILMTKEAASRRIDDKLVRTRLIHFILPAGYRGLDYLGSALRRTRWVSFPALMAFLREIPTYLSCHQ